MAKQKDNERRTIRLEGRLIREDLDEDDELLLEKDLPSRKWVREKPKSEDSIDDLGPPRSEEEAEAFKEIRAGTKIRLAERGVHEVRGRARLQLIAIVEAQNREPAEFKTFEMKQRIADALNELMTASKTRLKCPTCGKPARIKPVQPGGKGEGFFQFRHGAKSTHGGGASLENLEILDFQD